MHSVAFSHCEPLRCLAWHKKENGDADKCGDSHNVYLEYFFKLLFAPVQILQITINLKHFYYCTNTPTFKERMQQSHSRLKKHLLLILLTLISSTISKFY